VVVGDGGREGSGGTLHDRRMVRKVPLQRNADGMRPTRLLIELGRMMAAWQAFGRAPVKER
jgi:hypothetical protein